MPFLNAIIAVAAVGGSTNSVVHLLAIAGRLGIDLTLEDFDAAGAGVPVLANLQPSGRFLMDDLYRAGGRARAARRRSRTCCIPSRSPSPAGRSSTTSTAIRCSTTP